MFTCKGWDAKVKSKGQVDAQNPGVRTNREPFNKISVQNRYVSSSTSVGI